ncbi:PulJ/GspJ family protein [Mucilaginibacter pedocola]|uniref:Prepilin-type N-terminal cleavage/methylation domain-containing protein n=1 Tax=Mucilaginibacter pedocola TaxID=1792845 RepID=A0A1S9PBJ1_9SPHI|nr:hypothetical protein [Mucilaginibacter pedocola]OOQ58330.1 hypothetical protein BC343_11900 [Mucilaginibacter pedocola]
MNRKIKAFTIMEVTVSMLLAAIVVAVGFTAYDIMARSYAAYHKKHEGLSVLIQTDKLLQREFAGAIAIRFDGTGLALQDTGRIIRYEFSPEGILRREANTDTLKLQVSNVRYWFESQEITQPAELQLIDGLSFSALYEGKTFMYHYHKKYSSAELVSNTQHAH